ncbi:hypothetical protein QV06_08910 [Gallibacterium genomosp. 3]|uniref:Uncharacterized protein n=1 Tax=Gallibacterium genomosp. 3 TaxID=505345 RepID=A0A1A7PQJ8_9PAST|nr:hypothetical protein [Gallibacterium genomosp. 3]OBX03992.1 hypothetical protein QV06_08910 [Gallibacterium genomosp. 3]
MKIISKFKDLYDFKVAKYGIDEKLIYNRRTKKYSNEPNSYKISYRKNAINHSILLVGNQTVHLFHRENKVYSHFDLLNINSLQLSPSKQLGNLIYQLSLTFQDGTNLDVISRFFGVGTESYLYEMLTMDRKEFANAFVNKMFYRRRELMFPEVKEWEVFYNHPIVLIEYINHVYDFDNRKSIEVFKLTYSPNLQSIGIYIDPDFIWQSLVDFLSKQRSDKEVVPEISDDLKIQIKGFDKEVSFRPKMRKKIL